MLSSPYYAKNYAGIIDTGLMYIGCKSHNCTVATYACIQFVLLYTVDNPVCTIKWVFTSAKRIFALEKKFTC